MDDTWASRDLPVLDMVIGQLDLVGWTGGLPDGANIAAATELETRRTTDPAEFDHHELPVMPGTWSSVLWLHRRPLAWGLDRLDDGGVEAASGARVWVTEMPANPAAVSSCGYSGIVRTSLAQPTNCSASARCQGLAFRWA